MKTRTITITGAGGDDVQAYLAVPDGRGPRGGVVVIHHMPGYDRATKEITRRFAELGYDAICPNLYWREAPGAAPDDAAATAGAHGGVPDQRLIGDVGGVAAYLGELPTSNGKVGAPPEGFPLKAANLVDQLPNLRAPLLGLFGNEDSRPSPDQVAELDEILTAHHKPHEFHSYDDAGHAFFAVDRPPSRVAAANDGWQRIATFYGTYLGS